MNEEKIKQLQDNLWAAAEQLRANSSLKLNEISEPILGMIFLKFADVRFQKAKQKIEEERKQSQQGGRVRPISQDDYRSVGVLYVPETGTYSYLMNLAEGENIGKALNDAMEQIENDNHDLAGVLPKNYTSLHKKSDENNKILISLLKSFNQIPDDISGDAFGQIYEYFLGNFAKSEGQDGGEFFTAQPIVKLLVEIIEHYRGKIFDPACGSGGMFVQSARFVEEHLKNKSQIMNEVTIYGQEKTGTTVNIAKMNLAIHGLSGKITETNTYYEDVYSSVGKFDFVLANPPFNVKGKDKRKQIVIDPSRLTGDPRYYLGLPLTGKNEISNANYLWMQIFASALNSQGRAGFVMANSAADAGNSEKVVREKLINSGIVDVVISVGSNMFLNVTLPCTLFFFDKKKKNTERENKVLFVNAQDIYTVIDRSHNTWTDEQINEIVKIVRSYRNEDGYEDYKNIMGRCKVATIENIREHGYSLNPGRYIEATKNESVSVNINTHLKDLYDKFGCLTDDAHELEKQLQNNWKNVL